MTQVEGCSSIADQNGDLQFYTDGISVWNKNHILMANGTGLLGNSSSTQSALIVKQPGPNTIYYVFTTDGFCGPDGFRYNIIDISLNGGLGAVTLKNQLLYGPTSERLSACFHANGKDVWVVSHEAVGTNFVAYQLTPTGLLAPIISSVGPVCSNLAPAFVGNLKMSPNGKRLAIALGKPCEFWYCDFDNATGIVSNANVLTPNSNLTGGYSVEFSPSSDVLYAGTYDVFELYQWDLNAGSSAAIAASQITIPTQTLGVFIPGAIQLAPDGKIYYSRFSAEWLGAINSPNLLGLACNFVDSAVFLAGAKCIYGLPNFNQGIFQFVEIAKCCFGDTTTFILDDSLSYLTYQWDFGDPGSGPLNQSIDASTSHYFAAVGNYNVQLFRTKSIAPFSDTINFNIKINKSPLPFIGNDTTLCNGQSIILSPDSVYATYLWNNGNTTNTITANSTATYIVTVTLDGCSGTDSVNVLFDPCGAVVVNLASSDSIFCEKQCIDFTDLSTNNPTSWQWYFNGASPDTSTVQNPTNICYNNYGSFDVTLIACNTAGCDTLTLPGFINEYQSPIPSITQSNDTLFASPAFSYQWWNVGSGIVFGATNSFFVPIQAGAYYVIINDSNGCIGTSNVISITGVKENGLSSSIKIYPKPSNGKFYIELSDIPTEKQTLTLRNVIGQKLQELKLINKTTEVNFDAEDGVYFLTITTDTKGSYTEKIILQQEK
ncbi:MAG: PKD domain-containing protein [Bacteroidetes bacterium]|nr:PKD domain-containing protein [Bacteroidota bacterium]